MNSNDPPRYHALSLSPDATTQRFALTLHGTQRLELVPPVVAPMPRVTRGGLRRDTRLLHAVGIEVAIVGLLLAAILRWTPAPAPLQSASDAAPQPTPVLTAPSAAPTGTGSFVAFPVSSPPRPVSPIYAQASAPAAFPAEPAANTFAYVPPAVPLPPAPVGFIRR